jgi:hypothetical protein
MTAVLPHFGTLIDQVMVPASSGNSDALGILLLICKVFYIANSVEIVKSLRSLDALRPWISLF